MSGIIAVYLECEIDVERKWMGVNVDEKSGGTINPELEKLIRAQKVDQEISRKKTLATQTLPAQIQKLRESYENVKEELGRFDIEIADLSKKRRELEAQVEDNKAKIAQAKKKLPDVKTNVEYRAVLKELENFEKKNSEIDDSQLELMEKIEEDEKKRAPLKLKAAGELARFESQKKEKDEDIRELEKRVAELSAQSESIRDAVPPEILDNYEKVKKQRGGIGVARVLDGSCQACYQTIRPQLYYHIRTSGGLYQCPHCDRYLYYKAQGDEAG